MFLKETLDDVYKTKHTLKLALDRLSGVEKFCTEHVNFKNETLKRLEAFTNKIEDLEKQQNAIIECLNHDRKDINILITMIKKIQTSSTKRKK